MHKVKLTIVITALACTALSLGLVFYWLFYPYKTITFNGDYVTGKIHTQGEVTYYTVDYCKYTTAKATIVKDFVDGLTFTVSSPQAVLTLGCRKQEIKMTIPESLPPGEYQLRNTVTYQVNPIRSISVTHFSNWFTVPTPPDGSND